MSVSVEKTTRQITKEIDDLVKFAMSGEDVGFDALTLSASKVSDEVKVQALEFSGATILRLSSKAHADSNLSYSDYKRLLRELTTKLQLVEHYVFNCEDRELQPVNKVFSLPNLYGGKDKRLYDFLRRHNYIAKRDITGFSRLIKAATKMHCTTSEMIAMTEILIGNPKRFADTTSVAKYQSHPTYQILNKALEKLDLPTLVSQEDRDHYTSMRFGEVTFNVLRDLNCIPLALNLYSDKYSNEDGESYDRDSCRELKMHLNVYLTLINHDIANIDRGNKCSSSDRGDLTDSSCESLNHLMVALYCATPLIGSVILPIVIASDKPSCLINDITELSPLAKVSTHSTNAMILLNKKISPVLKMYSTYNTPALSFNKLDVDLRMLDFYVIEYCGRYPHLCNSFSDVLTDSNAPVEIKNQSFSSSVCKLIDKVGGLLKEERFDKYAAKLIVGDPQIVSEFKEISEKVNLLFDDGVYLTMTSGTEVSDSVFKNVRGSLEALDTVIVDIIESEHTKGLLGSAVDEGDYEKVSTLAKRLGDHDPSELVSPMIASVVKSLTILASCVTRIETDSQDYLAWDNPVETSKGKSSSNKKKKNQRDEQQVITKLTAEKKTVEQKLDALKGVLVDKNKQISTLEDSRKFSALAIDVERKFLFGEKTSISDVVCLIKAKFPHVTFADDIDNQLLETQYQNPAKLLKYMYLLCSDYYEAITQGVADAEARQILGNVYRARESDSVLNNAKFRKQREYKVNGEKMLFVKHLTVASAREDKSSCSVYFDIIGDSTGGYKIMIGYIGSHLDNTLT